MSNRPKRKASRYQQRLEAKQAQKSGRLIWVVLAGILGLAIIAGLALAGASGDGGSVGVVETGFAEVVGDSLPPYSGEPDGGVGAVAPALRATDMMSGDHVAIEPGDGTVYVLGFFAHWCPHCQAEVPRVVSRVAETPLPDGVEMVAIATGTDETAPNYPPSAWLNREKWPFAMYADSETGALATGFGLQSFPYWVVVGSDGHVLKRAAGELTDEQFDGLIGAAAADVG